MTLTFEYPLNERTRTFLRLEHLFAKIANFLPQEDPWAARAAVEGFMDAVTITVRADLRNELLKELERNQASISRVRNQPGVDPAALERVLDQLRATTAALQGAAGQAGQQVRDDPLVKCVAQRSAIPGGTCGFDLPQYHHWLMQSASVRRDKLADWMVGLKPMKDAIDLVLALARSSANPRAAIASEGFFQEALDTQSPAQLVRVGLVETFLFPEVSGHKNRFSIRFMDATTPERPLPFREDVMFTLTCCAF